MASAPETEKKITADRFLSQNIAALLRAIESPTKVSPSPAGTWMKAVYHQQSEKASEIDRQIERVRPYLAWLSEEEHTGVDANGLNRSIAFLRAFANSPAPVPMLAIGNDGVPSAFLNSGDVSLEATFENDCINYLFSDLASGSDGYFEDKCGIEAIPPSLMVLIYQHFARNELKEETSTQDD